jgi:hypothetical protein
MTMNRQAVMVICGHDVQANHALFNWLRTIGLEPREWDQLVTLTGTGSPFIGQVLQRAFQDVQAVVAFFTPDEHVCPRHGLRRPSGASSDWRLESRPNVYIEAGMALVTHPDQTIFVILGPQELPTDLAGRDYIRLDDTAGPLNQLANRLEAAGYKIDRSGTEWLKSDLFPTRTYSLSAVQAPNPPPPGKCQGRIDSPKDGDTAIGKWIQVRGRASDVPPRHYLWIAVQADPGGEFWPKGDKVTLDAAGHFDVKIIEEGDSPDFYVTLLLVTQEVGDGFRRWLNEGNRTRYYPSLLPSQYPHIELASVRLKRA